MKFRNAETIQRVAMVKKSYVLICSICVCKDQTFERQLNHAISETKKKKKSLPPNVFL